MKTIKIAIQGVRGSFHELAAQKYFGNNIACVECYSFKDVFDNVMNNTADFGITAIENTVAGTILPNYAMLRESNTNIIGEVYLHIQQNLLALNGQTIENIKEVHSHPMAILQCQHFFDKYPNIKLVEAEDTAAVARRISEKQLKNIGAIAGLHVADIYNLTILAEAIETHKKNYTRFLALSTSAKKETAEVNKSSLYFTIKHEKGNLANVLTLLAKYDINLTKIQSLPIVGREWEYYIHVDMEFENYSNYQNALNAIKPSLSEIKILGEYIKGEKIIELSSALLSAE